MLMAFGKFAVIGCLAAIGAIIPYGIIGMDGGEPLGWLNLLFFSLPASLLIGLPIAFLSFVLAQERLQGSPGTIFLMANLAGVVMLLTCYALAGLLFVIYFGGPAVIAANVYAVLGWFWVVKPMGAAQSAAPEMA